MPAGGAHSELFPGSRGRARPRRRCSTAVIGVKCFHETGRYSAKPRGGSISPLEEHAEFLLALIDGQPDLTLDEVVCAMRRHKISGSRTAVCHVQKKLCGRRSRNARTWRAHGGAGCENRACLTRPGWPCGTWPTRRSPRAQRPCSRTILVLAGVSSMNARRPSPSWPRCVGMA